MKKYNLHPSDIHLVLNLVQSSESFKTAESWTPICLPKFDSRYSHLFVKKYIFVNKLFKTIIITY